MDGFFKSLVFVAAFSGLATAQPNYTRMLGAFWFDLGALLLKVRLGRRQLSVIQGGHSCLYIPDWELSKKGFESPAISGDLTYCVVLNPYRRRSCVPEPGNYLIETYFEAGLGGFFVDRYDNRWYTGLYDQRFFTPSGIAGFRVHCVTARWTYILKLRLTPSLVSSNLTYDAGIGVSLGWR